MSKRVKSVIETVCVIIVLAMLAVAIFGCVGDEQRAEINAKIIELIETSGKDAAAQYIDKLVEEGRLGAKNGEDIKAAIPLGVEKVKEVMEEKR